VGNQTLANASVQLGNQLSTVVFPTNPVSHEKKTKNGIFQLQQFA